MIHVYSEMSTSDVFRDLNLLPPFPGIATKILRALSHSEASVQEIAELVRADAALSSELLRIANSSLYAFPAQISSIQRAVSLMGFDEVRKFVLAVSVKFFFFHPAMRLDLLRSIWRHSLACALVCEELSIACSSTECRDDQAYTTGLLHDIGRMGLCVVHPQEYAALLAGAEGDMLARERETFGIDHCEAGLWLAEKWELPEEVRRTVATHHQQPAPEGVTLEKIVQLGVLLTGVLGFDVTAPPPGSSLPHIRALLPKPVQYRYDPEQRAMQARIGDKLDALD